MSTTDHLHVAFNDTPEVTAANLNGVSRRQTARLQVTAKFVEDWLLQVAKNTNSRKEVVQVRVKGVC